MKQLNAQDVATEIERTLPVLREEASKAMHHAVELAKARLRETAPKGRTGRLSERVSGVVRETQAGVTGTIRPLEKYAAFVDKGTGLLNETGFHHPVRPTLHKTMRFVGRDGGVVFRGRTKGQPPTRFIERAKDEIAADVERVLTSGAEQATKRLF